MSEIEEMRQYVHNIAEARGWHVCPDDSFLEDLIEGLVTNKERYGYRSCPCREASGKKEYDKDIICPCRYAEPDIEEHGMCYCGLYVSKEIKEDPSKLGSIPERRPKELIEKAIGEKRED